MKCKVLVGRKRGEQVGGGFLASHVLKSSQIEGSCRTSDQEWPSTVQSHPAITINLTYRGQCPLTKAWWPKKDGNKLAVATKGLPL